MMPFESSGRGSYERATTPRQVRELLRQEQDREMGQFDEVFDEARGAAVRWMQKQRADLRQEALQLERERQKFAEEVQRLRREFEAERDAERERLWQDKQRAQQELHEASRQAREGRRSAPGLLEGERASSLSAHGREAGRVRLEMERHKRRAEEHARMERKVLAHNADASALLELKVGGTVFAAPKATLVQQPRSLFGQWISGRAPPPLDAEGRVHLDRDAQHFRSILNFLRNPEAPPTPSDAAEAEGLLREAEFYGVRFYPFPLVFAVGGHDGQGFLSSVELMDVENRCWRSCRHLRAERGNFGAAGMRTRAQVFGGCSAEYQALCDTEYLDPLRGEWLPSADLFTARRNCAGVGDGERAFAIGGFDGQRPLSSIEVLDARMKKWQTLPPMSLARSACAASLHDEQLWVLGGTGGESRLKSLEVFDLRASRWFQPNAGMLSVARSAGRAEFCLGELYAFGGVDESHNVCSSMECLGRNAPGRWTMLRSMLEPRMDFASCALGDMIMVSGGQRGETVASCEFYKPELEDWQFGPRMLTPRYGHQLILMNI